MFLHEETLFRMAIYIDESAIYDSVKANSLLAILEVKALNINTEPLLEPLWARTIVNSNGTYSPKSLITLSSNVLVGCSPLPALQR